MSDTKLSAFVPISSAGNTVSASIQKTVATIRERDPSYNSFVEITEQRAIEQATQLDQKAAAGAPLGVLAGVPYAVKNLFDVAGLTTLAGGYVNASQPPAANDAVVSQRLTAAGAVLVGTLNMDEHAYGFTTENSHYGRCRNPHDPSRLVGGSSGGSAAAVAAGLVPLTLGSDTNGSIRVPASLCGVFGLKPTFGRLSRRGTFPFVNSLDHLGPIAAHAADLALAYDIMQGPDAADTACAQRPLEATLDASLRGIAGLRVAMLGGYFDRWADSTARAAVRKVAHGLGAVDLIELPGAERARAAAFIITAAQGGALHRQRLITDYDAYEPLSRDRLVAGTLVPASWLMHAQRVRQQFKLETARVFEQYDLLLAAATPVIAPKADDLWLDLNGQKVPTRASLGMLTQPISCIGLPVCAVPVWPGAGAAATMPIGVQIIGAPWREVDCLAAAVSLERSGVCEYRQAR